MSKISKELLSILKEQYETCSDQELLEEALRFERKNDIVTARCIYYYLYDRNCNEYARKKYGELSNLEQPIERNDTSMNITHSYNNGNVQNNITYEDNLISLGIPEISDEELPQVINDYFTELQKLKNSVNESLEEASIAKESAETASRWVKDEHGFWIFKWTSKNTEETVNNLQKAATDLAKALQTSAQAQKVSFENQEKIGQITRYLFALGVSNMAANRSVVNRLRQELKGTPKSKLNEMARREIYAVIRQLKAQEDLWNKQKTQGEILREHNDKIKQLSDQQNKSITKEEHDNDLNDYLRKLEGIKNLISDAEKGLLEKIGKSQTIENAKIEKQAFINANEEQKKALAEEVKNRNKQVERLAEQQKKTLQGFDTKLTETVDEQKKALAEEVKNRNEQVKQLEEQQQATLQELEERNNKNLTDAIQRSDEKLSEVDSKYTDTFRSLTNNIDEYKAICNKQEREIEDLKNKLNDLNAIADNKLEKKTAIGITLLAIVALCVAALPYVH